MNGSITWNAGILERLDYFESEGYIPDKQKYLR